MQNLSEPTGVMLSGFPRGTNPPSVTKAIFASDNFLDSEAILNLMYRSENT